MVGVYKNKDGNLFKVVERSDKIRTHLEIAPVLSIGKNILHIEISREELKEK